MLTSRLDAYISRYGDFCANNNNDDTTDYFTPYACMRGNEGVSETHDHAYWIDPYMYTQLLAVCLV